MRALIYLLLASNLLFFGWARWVDSPVRAGAGTTGVAAPQLAAGKPKSFAQCLSLGPFTDTNQVLATTAAAALTARGINSQLRQLQHKVSDGWWVYVGGLGSAAVREGAKRRLTQAGIRDVGDVAGDERNDRISVGIFSEHQGALKRAAEVEAANVIPTIEERQRTVVERWLNVEFPGDASPPMPAELGVAADSEPAPTWVECPAAVASG